MRKVDEKMLVARMEAMLGEICGVRVVEKVVEGCDDRTAVDLRKSEIASSIEGCINADGDESSKEREYGNED